MAVQLLTSVQNVKKRGVLSGDLDPDKIKQYIEVAQDTEIQNLLGTDLFTRLKAGKTAGDLSANETTLLNTYVVPALDYFALLEIIHNAPYTVSSKGVYKHISENAETVDKSEVDSLAERQRQKASFYARRLVDYLCNNSSLFSEYSTNTNEDMNPSTTTDFTGWVL